MVEVRHIAVSIEISRGGKLMGVALSSTSGNSLQVGSSAEDAVRVATFLREEQPTSDVHLMLWGRGRGKDITTVMDWVESEGVDFPVSDRDVGCVDTLEMLSGNRVSVVTHLMSYAKSDANLALKMYTIFKSAMKGIRVIDTAESIASIIGSISKGGK